MHCKPPIVRAFLFMLLLFVQPIEVGLCAHFDRPSSPLPPVPLPSLPVGLVLFSSPPYSQMSEKEQKELREKEAAAKEKLEKEQKEKEAKEAANSATVAVKAEKSAIVFKVLFASSDVKLNLKQEKFKDIVNGSFYKAKEIYKYTSGNFVLMKDASAHQNALREKGFKDCFVIAMKNGERMDVAEAKKEVGQ